MLKDFSPADETRHHAQLKALIGQSGLVTSFTQNQDGIFVLVKLAQKSQLVRWYAPQITTPKIGDRVTIMLGKQLLTDDQRVIYNLIALPAPINE